MPERHVRYLDWTPERILSYAGQYGPSVKALVQEVMAQRKFPEQAYKSCSGILSLARKVGQERLILACRRADSYGVYNYAIVMQILEKRLDTLTDEELEHKSQMPAHPNIRGNEYYQ